MSLTPFGRFMRDLRRQRQMSLADCDRRLSMPPEHLAALECGQAGFYINEPLVKKIERVMALTASESKALRHAVRASGPCMYAWGKRKRYRMHHCYESVEYPPRFLMSLCKKLLIPADVFLPVDGMPSRYVACKACRQIDVLITPPAESLPGAWADGGGACDGESHATETEKGDL